MAVFDLVDHLLVVPKPWFISHLYDIKFEYHEIILPRKLFSIIRPEPVNQTAWSVVDSLLCEFAVLAWR